jgi:hypothetical protein
MKDTKEPTFINDVSTDSGVVVRKPFRLSKENQRRFIRLEISSPMSLQKIKDGDGGFWPEGDWHVIRGIILNISAGGVLVELEQAVASGDVVSMRFTLQDVEELPHVLGLVKRSDIDETGCLAGIEFIGREYLKDHFSNSEVDLLGDMHKNFDESVRHALNKYVYHETGQKESR